MTEQGKRRPAASGAAPKQSTATTTSIVALPGDELRARLSRLLASRELDELLGPAVDKWSFLTPVDGDPYHDGHLDLTWTARGALGDDLAAAGWSP